MKSHKLIAYFIYPRNKRGLPGYLVAEFRLLSHNFLVFLPRNDLFLVVAPYTGEIEETILVAEPGNQIATDLYHSRFTSMESRDGLGHTIRDVRPKALILIIRTCWSPGLPSRYGHERVVTLLICPEKPGFLHSLILCHFFGCGGHDAAVFQPTRVLDLNFLATVNQPSFPDCGTSSYANNDQKGQTCECGS